VARPAVDVVVPFAGSAARLDGLIERLSALPLGPRDTLVVADNRSGAQSFVRGAVHVLAAGDFRGSYHARNLGARAGSAPWLLFVDADVTPAPDLLDRLFDPTPGERTAVLAGAVHDEEPAPGRGSLAQRYAWLKASMSQEHTLGHAAAFAQTANCAVRREAFAAVGGFADEVRSGGDADLCLRLTAAGWALESRPAAVVVHGNRQTVPRMLAQRARHGAGAAWVGQRHPGALPARSLPGVAWWGVRRAASGLRALAGGDRDGALVGLLDGPAVLAFELGRRLPNRRLRQPRRR
jgi:GT2 family glycosyltransferase